MDARQVAQGIAEGIASIPVTFGYSVRRTWEGSGAAGSDLKARNSKETERFIALIRSAVNKEEPIRKLVMIVITEFYTKLNDNGKKTVNGKLNRVEGKLVGRSLAQFYVANKIASTLIRKASYGMIYKRFISYSTTVSLNIVMFQGMIEQSALASRRMQVKYPWLYYKVRGMNLDMAYFLVEDFLEPYLIYISSPSQQFCAGVDNELDKILSR
ncbi:Uncharacterised protein [Serratia rubidaea]|uniref:hypothetical protein n=1 Tax=Serratia rubidaea TaxID=61652 RepID=UPI0006C75198|nr:hypothetical protein [Serratia rubidaea]MBD8452482.1 hypothetical protein [Serratia rubidaea]QPR63366.1 hypothetical protein I6G83_21680 [Serratia rubidaea]CAI0737025.1 Uncharacterised protein [Serratia rubidaea]CAI1543397.1 Uncharacterised protein [Serratia rubidaea]HAY0635367.1 hypothetical protein [Serratia rubidaea]